MPETGKLSGNFTGLDDVYHIQLELPVFHFTRSRPAIPLIVFLLTLFVPQTGVAGGSDPLFESHQLLDELTLEGPLKTISRVRISSFADAKGEAT